MLIAAEIRHVTADMTGYDIIVKPYRTRLRQGRPVVLDPPRVRSTRPLLSSAPLPPGRARARLITADVARGARRVKFAATCSTAFTHSI